MSFYFLMSTLSDIQSIYKQYNYFIADYFEDKNHRFLHELNKRLLAWHLDIRYSFSLFKAIQQHKVLQFCKTLLN
jgi:hypothetical protein